MRKMSLLLPLMVFAAAFVLVPWSLLESGALMPGNLGDSRLNNYFLENTYQFLLGRSDSLWHLPFFYPHPYIVGFSDNLFGTAPVYIALRVFGLAHDTAFQGWFLLAYPANFAAAFYSLRRFGFSGLAATTGALIFAFALPTIAHAGHPQLHHRFAIPLVMVFLFGFLQSRQWRLLIIAGYWLVWQFYTGFYMGFFALFLSALMIVAFLLNARCIRWQVFLNTLSLFVAAWKSLDKRTQWRYFLHLTVLLAAMILLFYPYIQVSLIYGAGRGWAEISTMLPRWQSYLAADYLPMWASLQGSLLSDVPMRHEHQMFAGVTTWCLVFAGLLMGSRLKTDSAFPLMAGVLALCILLTLNIGGFSLWYLLHKLPLFSAIRAVTRIDQALLFPMAFFAAVAMDYLRESGPQLAIRVGMALLVLGLLLAEYSMIRMPISSKAEWRAQIMEANKAVPDNLASDSILFLAQASPSFFVHEIDAMWVAMLRGVKTLNGYSGNYPPGYSVRYGRDCSELEKRLRHSSQAIKASESLGARDFRERLVLVGFNGCGNDQAPR
jgi:hypothetical protein